MEPTAMESPESSASRETTAAEIASMESAVLVKASAGAAAKGPRPVFTQGA
jgi:hypothetical protein